MLEKVISGGQTGADQSGWRAAKRFGIVTGGWMPKGWLTEDGPRPDFESTYNAQEHRSSEYPPRTMSNVLSADATIWFGRRDSRGFGCTMNACRKGPRPHLVVIEENPEHIVIWLEAFRYPILNVAGNRESSAPGIGEWVEAYLCDVFRLLGFNEVNRNVSIE